jgi:hypothetical protein
MFPLRKRLSFYWESATGSKTLYSPVYAKQGTAVFKGDDPDLNGTAPMLKYAWMKATPIAGTQDRYAITLVRHDRRAGFIGQTLHDSEYRIRKMGGDSSFSYNEVLLVLACEERSIEQEGYAVTESQPFSRALAPRPGK